MHWADATAQRLTQKGDSHVISTGITPSGHIHVGNMREALTGDILRRACSDAGMDAEMIYIADTADPLRKVYPFLDESYEQYIGHPLGMIPAPDEKGRPEGDGTYAEHFLKPFLAALEETGVKFRVVDNLEAYESGEFAECARILCDNAAEVREVIERVSGRELAADWFPYNPRSPSGSMDGIVVTNWEWPYVNWRDSDGNEGRSDLRKGQGKLPWRLDWPSKWHWLGVTFEAFGKDHGTAGGSYDTGVEISRILGSEPPMGFTYEWISLKGQGAMSSSTGVTMSARELLDIVPPELMRYLISRTKPKRAIDFDTGVGLMNMADEFERLSSSIPEMRERLQENPDMKKRKKDQLEDSIAAWKYSLVNQSVEDTSTSVSFSHLAMVAQVKPDDDSVWESLESTHSVKQGVALENRLWRMRNWISGPHFPDSARIEVSRTAQKPWFEGLGDGEFRLIETLNSSIPDQSDENTISNWIRSAAEASEIPMRQVYQILYGLYLGMEKGPRLASLLSAVGIGGIKAPLEDAISRFG